MQNFQSPVAPVLALLLAFPLLPSSIQAGPLDPSHVPADAKWVIHVDFESFSESGLFDKLVAHRPQMVKAVHGWLGKNYGMDPPEDFRSATMFIVTIASTPAP